MSQALFLNYVYILLDVVMLILGLLFVWKWGKRGLLALTLWLFVIGLMALTAGDLLATMADNFDKDFVINSGGYYEVSSKDFAYIPAVIIWIVAFAIPIKFAFFDSKKKPQGDQAQQPPQAPGQPMQPLQPATLAQMPPQQPGPPQLPPQAAPQQEAPPQQYQGPPQPPMYPGQGPPPANQGQGPPPAYQGQGPPPAYQGQAPPPAYQQAPPPAYQRQAPPPQYQQPPR